MKFGKSLTNNAFPPWSKNYIAYKALKQHIKLAQLAKTKGTIAIEPHETEFFYDLNDELEKVNRFYLHKRSELERRVVALEAKFRQLLAVGAPPSPHFHLPSKVESLPYTAETVTNESLEGTDLENARSLLNSLVETRDHLHKLIRFSQVNKEGFRKILKKFDKKLGTKVQHEYMASRVSSFAFAQAQTLDCQLQTVERCFHTVLQLVKKSQDSSPRIVGKVLNRNKALQQGSLTSAQVDRLRQALKDDDTTQLQSVLAHVTATFQTNGDLNGHATASRANAARLGQGLYLIMEGACHARAQACLAALATEYPEAAHLHDINERTILHRLCMRNGFTQSLNAVFGILPQMSPQAVLWMGPGYFPTNKPTAGMGTPITKGTGFPLPAHPSPEHMTETMQLALIEQLLQCHAWVEAIEQQDIFGRTPLHYAAVNGLAGPTRTLLRALYAHKPHADVNTLQWYDHEGCTPLFYAVVNNHLDVVTSIIDVGRVTDVDTAIAVPVTPTALSPTVELDGPQEAATVLSTSQSFVLVQSQLNTPLALACKLGYAAIAKFLLTRGANVNMTDGDGETPLYMAARHGHLAVLKVLTDSSLSTQAKPEINKAEKYSGWTPLIMAAQEGYLACVQHLLAVHADPNVLDHTGWNAHERAAYCGHCQVAEVLRPLSRPPIEALMQLKASKPLVSPGQPASQSSEGKAAELKSDANLSFIERTYGHTYLQNQALLVLTMGSNDTTDQTTPVNLRSDLFDVIFNTVSPATALSLVISADTAMDLPTTLDLPLDGHTRLEPIQLLCSLDRDVTVQIDLVPTYGDRSQLLGRAVASLPMNALSTHIPTSAAGCEKVQVTLLSTPALQPLGTIQFEYLLIKPYAHRNVPVETRAMYWKSLKTKVIGHRGSGMNHDTTGGSHLQVGENTVLSFVTAANLGAEYVEFDVQLTKDRVPVLYHDWTVTETGLGVPVHSLTCNEFLALRPHKHSNRRQGHADPSMAFGGQETKRQAGIAMNVVDTVPGPRRAITSPPKAIPGSQPPPIKPLPRTNRSNSISAHYRPASPNLDPKAVKHSVSGRTDSPEQGTTSRSVSPASSTASHLIEDERVRNILHEELDKIIKGKGLPKKVKGNNAQTIQAPFTTLKEAFQQVPAHIGFNIEVKYPMKCEARGAEVWSHLELNQFVDSILDVVYTHAQQRSVIFSSFHPDICLMLNLKQPNFPVFFLTDGGYFDYVDARCNSLQEAVRFAKNAGLLGIVSVSTLVLQAPVLAPAIKEQGLLLFTYGTLNNNVACVQLQKELDVDAVIVDSVMAVRKSLQDN